MNFQHFAPRVQNQPATSQPATKQVLTGYLATRLLATRLLVMGLMMAVVALFATATPAQADTIIIEPGNASGPNTFGADHIAGELASNHFTLDTSDGSQASGGGPDEIHILPGVVITWTSEYSLTLLAGADVLITGTVQHDGPGSGPNSGAGGIRV
ncbi:MAG: hypothetical protein WDZ49_13225, partial [Litorilinea sp.]